MRTIIDKLADKLTEIGQETARNFQTDLMRDMAHVFNHYMLKGEMPATLHIYARENGTNMYIPDERGIDTLDNTALEYFVQQNCDPTMVAYVIRLDTLTGTAEFEFVGSMLKYSQRYGIYMDYKAYEAALCHYHAKKVLARAEKQLDPAAIKAAVHKLWQYHHIGRFTHHRVLTYLSKLSWDNVTTEQVLQWAEEEHNRLLVIA